MAASPFCGAPSGKVQLAGQPRRRQPLVGAAAADDSRLPPVQQGTLFSPQAFCVRPCHRGSQPTAQKSPAGTPRVHGCGRHGQMLPPLPCSAPALTCAQVVLSLLLNLLLLGASATWWSGSFTLSANGRRSGSRSDIAPRRRAPVARGADAWEACERAQLDVQKLADWGCTVFDRVCFDQVGAGVD